MKFRFSDESTVVCRHKPRSLLLTRFACDATRPVRGVGGGVLRSGAVRYVRPSAGPDLEGGSRHRPRPPLVGSLILQFAAFTCRILMNSVEINTGLLSEFITSFHILSRLLQSETLESCDTVFFSEYQHKCSVYHSVLQSLLQPQSAVTLRCEELAYRSSRCQELLNSGVGTGGSGGSMNRGPRAPGAPE